jgi:hypothetical protein
MTEPLVRRNSSMRFGDVSSVDDVLKKISEMS